MKAAITLLILLGITTATYAQDTSVNSKSKTGKEQKNEIGVIAETGFSYEPTPGNTDLMGLQYKRWLTPNKAFRVVAAYGEYNWYDNFGQTGKYNDTIEEKDRDIYIPNNTLGLGIAIQRKFYKHVYLYATLELRGSYGKGHYTDVISKRVEDKPAHYQSAPVSNIITMFAVTAVPAVGIKLEYKYFGLGTEVSAARLSYTNLSYRGPIGTHISNGLDWALGALHQRFFAYCRF